MDKGAKVTDPELLAQLNAPAKVTDPELLTQLNTPVSERENKAPVEEVMAYEPAPMSVTETLAAMKKGGPHAKMKEIAAGLTTGSVGALADTASNLTQDTNLSDLVTGQKPSKFAQRYADRS